MDLRKIMKCSTWTGATVFSMLLVVTIQFLLVISPDIVAAVAFDDFSNDKIDSSKWSQQEFVRVVEDGMLSMAIRQQTDKNGDQEVETVFKDPASITKMQARVVISAYQLDPDITTAEHQLVGAEIYGSYLGSTDGDVEAGVIILDRNNGQGLQAACWYSSDGDSFEDHEFFSMSIETGHPYILAVEYNDVGQKFTCSITDGNDSNVTETSDLDASSSGISGPPTDEEKALAVWYEIDEETDGTFDAEGSLSVTFDDIETDGTSYDNFSLNVLDSSKWDSVESVRRITDNSLELSQHSEGIPYRHTRIQTADTVHGTDYYQVSILIDPVSSCNGATTMAQTSMGGVFYNDIVDGGNQGMVGDNIATIAFTMSSDNSLKAEAMIWRCNNADCSSIGYPPVWSQEFTTKPLLDTPQTVSIKSTGDSLTYDMEGEKIVHPITQMFTSFNSTRMLETFVWSNDDENGTMVAFFDNVYFEKPTSPWALFLPAILTSARNNK